ncbi:DUF1800 domain-containing protein [Halieaceae bacterium IMCC14734]|uniref:DUF1800 domain-containing protein n=1 Tax=Candidatus Litorirhabdus singularis TaxID=2518993 RepID=A0ABT3THN7_9GAMM|nr:DUF1800 family protein [Candidatus Litorirhabdus singularis]MCX2981813.1 DUF1800 domain-containing protein [Candidatus Litorirhabdus singularis]
MKTKTRALTQLLLIIFIAIGCIACGGEEVEGGGFAPGLSGSDSAAPNDDLDPDPDPATEALTPEEAARFLSQATFGPTQESIDQLASSSLEAWFTDELDKTASLHLPYVLASFGPGEEFLDEKNNVKSDVIYASDSFWLAAIEGDDQLRQRMAFALSQIFVISTKSRLDRTPQTVAAYMDVLTEGAFGNYRDLLEEITYSPAMGVYLTYLRNQKANETIGREPDENFAREIMQLFTIGLVELNQDGTPVTDSGGVTIKTYNNEDITGLAKVFTGLSYNHSSYWGSLQELPKEALYQPMVMFEEHHSPEEKAFLGQFIREGVDGASSISSALDTLFNHTNVGPFIGRILIQRFVTSDPEPAYIERVADAFDAGSYTLPSGDEVGEGRRGDLTATLAAVLFDEVARDRTTALESLSNGKLREPVIRFTHWARAFRVNSADANNEVILRDASSPKYLAQHPYGSPSVFNFYRPGYVAPGTETGDAGMTVPELQIFNATSSVGYPNVLTLFSLGISPKIEDGFSPAFVPNYSTEISLAEDAGALLDHLNLLLTHGTLREDTRARIAETLSLIPPNSDEQLLARVQLASVMVMTAPEYIVLR